MPTNNTKISPIRRSLGRPTRTALLSFAVAGAVAASTFVGERAASANIAEDVASMFVRNAISCLASGNTKNFGICIMTGPTKSFSLSSSDLASIKDIVSEELDEHSLTALSAQSDGVISDASEYYRNETASISALQQSYAWAESIHDDAEDVMDHLVGYGLDGARGYYVLASIRHAMLVEMYNIEVAKSALAGTLGSGEYVLGTGDLANFRENRIQSEAQEVADYLGGWSDDVDTAFWSVAHSAWTDSGTWTGKDDCISLDNWWGTYRKSYSNYCYPDPTSSWGSTCHTYEYWTCTHDGGDNYNEDTDKEMKATANIAWQKARLDYRNDMIGELAYETIYEFDKADAGGFEYCGNGTCAIGEFDSCSADCTETGATTGNFDQLTSYASWTTSATTTLLSNADATLKWQSDGNLVLYATDGSSIWASRTSGTSATGLSFQSDGNLVVANSQYIWGTQTVAGSSAGKATKMVLIGKVAHLVDADGISVWNSDTDWNRHSSGYDGSGSNTNDNPNDIEDTYSGRFCLDTSVRTTLLKNGDLFGFFRYKLDWTNDGDLVIYDPNGAVWSSNTSGSGGKYVCNQEDGNLIIYDDELNVLWHTDTDDFGPGNQLQLVREQLRVVTAAGDVVWASGACSADDCKYEVKSSSSFGVSKGTSSKTILQNGKAKLVLTSAGYLQIVSRATGSALWTSNVSGSPASFSNGTLKIGSTVINGDAGSKLFLADCNLFIGKANTNRPVYSTHTECE